jgi:hypothetical protein
MLLQRKNDRRDASSISETDRPFRAYSARDLFDAEEEVGRNEQRFEGTLNAGVKVSRLR